MLSAQLPIMSNSFILDDLRSPSNKLMTTFDCEWPPITTSASVLPRKREREAIEIEPTPIGPSVKVVDAIPIERMNFHGGDLILDSLLPVFLEPADTADCQGTPSKVLSMHESPNKRRKISCEDEQLQAPTTTLVQVDGSSLGLKSDKWYDKYQELCSFHKKYGHCNVPIKTSEGDCHNALSQWVKRQRHQYKLKRLGRHSTLCEKRETALQRLEFCWDSHEAGWQERFAELLEFRSKHGHCVVPTKHPENPQLSIWVKCQRRQYKLYLTGKKTAISFERIAKLDQIDFDWNPRNLRLE